jgi:REP element-mobilizing transposase RayT
VAYKPRNQERGLHHVVIRGNNRRDVFLSEGQRATFLKMLGRVAEEHEWRPYTYALMRNHFHLVLGIGDRGLAGGMCELNTGYARWFNKATGRINHLFGKRYWSEYLEDERRLLAAVRYVVQNPRRAGADGPLESHTETSYAATIGLARSPVKLATNELLQLFSRNRDDAIVRFRRFCEEPAPPRETRRQPPSRNRHERRADS